MNIPKIRKYEEKLMAAVAAPLTLKYQLCVLAINEKISAIVLSKKKPIIKKASDL